jgi:hypothetical protein
MRKLFEQLPNVLEDLNKFRANPKMAFCLDQEHNLKNGFHRQQPIGIEKVRNNPTKYIGTREEVDAILETPSKLQQLQEYEGLLEDPGQVLRRVESLSALRRVYQALLTVSGCEPYRAHWDYVLSCSCSSDVANPCGMCNTCGTRICEAAMVVFASQGCTDGTVLGHLGTIF